MRFYERITTVLGHFQTKRRQFKDSSSLKTHFPDGTYYMYPSTEILHPRRSCTLGESTKTQVKRLSVMMRLLILTEQI